MKYIFCPFLLVFSILLVSSCGNDDDPSFTSTVTVNGTVLFDDGDDFTGDVDGDFTSDGGSATKTFLWQNPLSTADYNADITATTEGSFQMIVKDADGNIVLDRTLNGAVEPDSFSAVGDTGD